MEFTDSDDEYYDYDSEAESSQVQRGGVGALLKVAKVASVAVPGGPAAVHMLEEAYAFKKKWNSAVGKMHDLEGIIYNTMQPNGIYARVLVTGKLTSIDGVPTHIYNTGIFFNALEEMVKLVADWNAHNNALKEHNDWEEIKELIGEFEKTPPGEVSEKEMQHIQDQVRSAETDEAMLVNLVTKYENCAILRDIHLKACIKLAGKKPCQDRGDSVLHNKSIGQVLSEQIKSQPILKAKYVSGNTVDYVSYANDRIINDFKKGITTTKNQNYICYQIGAQFSKNSNVLSNEKLYEDIIKPRMKQIAGQIRKVAKAMKKGKKAKVKPSRFSKYTKKAKGFGSKMRDKANRFSKNMQEMTPRKMKGAMSKAYLAKKLDMFMGRYKSLQSRWSFVVGCLHLEVTYDMWEEKVRNDPNTSYKKWLQYSNEIVIRLHKCMSDPNASFEKATARAKRQGLGCVLLAEVEKHVKGINYSKGFEDILKGHMTNLTSVAGELKKAGTKEGAAPFDVRRLQDKQETKLQEELEKHGDLGSSVESSSSASSSDATSSATPAQRGGSSVSSETSTTSYNNSDSTDCTDSFSYTTTLASGDTSGMTSGADGTTSTSVTSVTSDMISDNSTESNSYNTYLFTDN